MVLLQEMLMGAHIIVFNPFPLVSARGCGVCMFACVHASDGKRIRTKLIIIALSLFLGCAFELSDWTRCYDKHEGLGGFFLSSILSRCN